MLQQVEHDSTTMLVAYVQQPMLMEICKAHMSNSYSGLNASLLLRGWHLNLSS